MNKLLITLILTIATTLSLHAQSIRVLAWDQDIAKRKLSIASEHKYQSITGMHHLTRSKAIQVPAKSQNLQIVATDRLSEDGKPLTIALTIPEGIQKPLLIIIPDEEAPTGIKTIVIDDSLKTFDWGTLLFINSTDENLALKYDEESVIIPNELKPSVIALGGKNRNIGISITSEKDPEQPSLYSAIWKQRNDLRQLILITPANNKTSARLNFKFITENKAAIEAHKQ